jgi:5'-3' exoribonuclease 1
MGIPAYFSYIVKKHRQVIALYKNTFRIDNFYMDCNSIIYDVIHSLNKDSPTIDLNKFIIRSVIARIEEIVALINPSRLVFIAFDGVAPVAKLEQQRTRRYKSWFQNNYTEQLLRKKQTFWDTVQITPGTSFMNELNESVITYFNIKNREDIQYVVSTSYNEGEGEHKIFEHIRTTPVQSSSSATVAVYGLDADLIMLTLNHLHCCPNMYLFRETPEFIKYIDATLEPGENYMLHINELSDAILSEMVSETIGKISNLQKLNYVCDYIVMCFFLGNDFMPHFPSLNIRTNGIDTLMTAYQSLVKRIPDFFLTDFSTKRIRWNSMYHFIKLLGDNEFTNLIDETRRRDRYESILMGYKKMGTPEEKMKDFDNIPNRNRELEKYINPYSSGWEKRYYEALFSPSFNARDVSKNYIEGLEWTLRYYSVGCPDWSWTYRYSYPPLLKDLLTMVPDKDDFICIKENKNCAVAPLTQLCYVLNHASLHYLPKKVENVIREKYMHLYPSNCQFRWSYCKYFWESHVEFPEMNIAEIEKMLMF